jgi:hypothetical protein
VNYAARGKAVDEQNDITPANKFIGQLPLCRVGHAATAMQSDDRGKRACTLGLGQIPLYAVARHDGTPKERLRGAFKLNALERCSQGINDHEICDTPKHQPYGGLISASCAQWSLP